MRFELEVQKPQKHMFAWDKYTGKLKNGMNRTLC